MDGRSEAESECKFLNAVYLDHTHFIIKVHRPSDHNTYHSFFFYYSEAFE